MIRIWSKGPADDHMSEDMLVHLEPIIRRHPWWNARASLLLSLLERGGVPTGARVLDAGCGWGVTFEALERRGYRTDGLDISSRALQRLDRSDRTLIEADLLAALPEDVQPYDAVVALDVIEHIDDDRAAVANLRRLTRPGGIAIVSVPALPELFTEFDQVQGHRRRYVPETLRQAFAGSGFTVEEIMWWGSWLVPLLRWQRSRQQSRQRPRKDMTATEIYAEYVKLPPRLIATALRTAFMIDHHLALRRLITRGTSLIAIARA